MPRTFRASLRRGGRRTNAAILLLLIGAFLSGWLAFATAGPLTATLVGVVHGLFGLGLVALVPWKTMIIRRAHLRPASLVLLVLVLACLVAGFVQLGVGFVVVAGLSPIQVHVGAALIAAPVLVWHVRSRRRQRLRTTDLSRRTLIRGGVVLGGLGAAYAGLVGIAQLTRGPQHRPVATGSRPLDPAAIPATIWLLDRVPMLDPGHRVDVAGRALTAADLTVDAEHVVARLDCTSGWYAEAGWSGRRLADLVDPAELASAASLVVTSVTGYRRTFPTAAAADLWLVTACQGRALTAPTGAPVRLVAPGYRGFWWVKWVASVELSARPAWRQLPFPPQ